MNFVGIDLHKKSVTLCVVGRDRQVLARKTLPCQPPEPVRRYLESLRPFQAVLEATASYDWLYELAEPLAERLLLAHPRKLRVIAESTRKSDRLDAQVLAELLAADLIPTAYRPSPRQRQHRALVRYRQHLRQRTTRAKNKLRRVVANYNADRRNLFTAEGLAYLRDQVAVSPADRFVLDQLLAELDHANGQLAVADRRLRQFAREAPLAEREARASLGSVPGVGAVTVDVVLSEVGDVRRFRSAKQVVAYAGLAPGQRESAGKTKELGISKEGSRLLRWALVEAAWRLVRFSPRWARIHDQLRRRRGKKKAIVAVARRLLTVLVAVWRDGATYDPLGRSTAAR
jgi:transposase